MTTTRSAPPLADSATGVIDPVISPPGLLGTAILAPGVSRDNVEIVRQVYEAAGRHDREAVFGLYDSDVTLDLSRIPVGGLTGQAIYQGHDGLSKMFRDWYEAFDYHEHLNELIDAGDRVVSVTTGHGRGRASGTNVQMTFYLVWTLRDGRVVRLVWFPTRDEALKAAGVSE